MKTYLETKEKSKCCGCSGCEAVCPKSAVIMAEDEKGFRYPEIDQKKCIHCNACTRFCDFSFVDMKPSSELKSFVRESSGGILLSSHIMSDIEKITERLVAIVNEMRENAEDMREWRNLPLADEFMQLLRGIDDAEEQGIGQVRAIEAMVDYLPEYDVPRRVLAIRRYEQEQLALSSEDDLKNDPYLAE